VSEARSAGVRRALQCRVAASVATTLLLSFSNIVQAQDCRTIVTRTAPPGIEHAFVRTVAVRTDAPI